MNGQEREIMELKDKLIRELEDKGRLQQEVIELQTQIIRNGKK